MATKAQQAALTASKYEYNTAKKNTNYSKKVYGTSFKNYRDAVNKGYKPSSKVTSYQNASDKALAAAKAMGDFKYNSNYSDKITGLLDKAKNMNFDFNYSLTDDPAYTSYRDQYVHNGQLAAQEAAGNAATQTGGYGSTASVAASQQAYNESLTQLNNIVPDLYDKAYNRQWNEFTDERDTLQQLASAYQSLDQQEYDQALSTWTNNFNQYIIMANEYQSKYEYLDGAERSAYENKLDNLYNMLTTAQKQYNTNQSLQLDALNAYGGMANDMANYDLQAAANAENARHNRATEAAAAAQLNEQRRQYDTTLALNKEPVSNTKNANAFIASIRTKQEFQRRSTSDYKNYGNYTNYVAGKITEWLDSGKISSADASYLYDYYGLGE